MEWDGLLSSVGFLVREAVRGMSMLCVRTKWLSSGRWRQLTLNQRIRVAIHLKFSFLQRLTTPLICEVIPRGTSSTPGLVTPGHARVSSTQTRYDSDAQLGISSHLSNAEAMKYDASNPSATALLKALAKHQISSIPTVLSTRLAYLDPNARLETLTDLITLSLEQSDQHSAIIHAAWNLMKDLSSTICFSPNDVEAIQYQLKRFQNLQGRLASDAAVVQQHWGIQPEELFCGKKYCPCPLSRNLSSALRKLSALVDLAQAEKLLLGIIGERRMLRNKSRNTFKLQTVDVDKAINLLRTTSPTLSGADPPLQRGTPQNSMILSQSKIHMGQAPEIDTTPVSQLPRDPTRPQSRRLVPASGLPARTA
jgi:hypothetical protein